MLDIAVRTAYARRGVAHLTLPNDLQVAQAGGNPYAGVGPARPPATAPIRLAAPGRPSPDDLQRLADVLNASARPAILAGAGALHARAELLAVAGALGAPIIKTLSGKATVPDDSPYTTGGVVVNNNSLGQILWEQMVLGYPEHGVRYPEPFVDYTAIATANGALGIKVTKPAEVRNALGQALGHDGPALVDVDVNPDEPPLPGKVEYKQARTFAEAFLRGQPRKATIATTLFRDKIDQLKP